MMDLILAYFTYMLSLLFCFVISRLEQRKRKSKVAATTIAFVVIGGLFRRVSIDGVSLSDKFNIPHLLAATGILAALLGITVLSKKLLTLFFGDDLAVK